MVKKKKPGEVAPWLLEPALSMKRVARTLDQLEAFVLPNPAGQHTLRTVRKARAVLESIPADQRLNAALFGDLFCCAMWTLDQESFDLKEKGAKQRVYLDNGTKTISAKAAKRKAQWPKVLKDLKREIRRELTYTEKLEAIRYHEKSQDRSISDSTIKRSGVLRLKP